MSSPQKLKVVVDLKELEDPDVAIARETNSQWKKVENDLSAMKEEFAQISHRVNQNSEQLDTTQATTNNASNKVDRGEIKIRQASRYSSCCCFCC